MDDGQQLLTKVIQSIILEASCLVLINSILMRILPSVCPSPLPTIADTDIHFLLHPLCVSVLIITRTQGKWENCREIMIKRNNLHPAN